MHAEQRADVSRLACRQLGHITTGQVRRLGVSYGTLSRMVTRGDVLRVHHGVYRLAGAPTSFRGQVLAAVLGAGSGAAASHVTAARLLGLNGFDHSHSVEITVPASHAPRLDGVIVHASRQLEPVDVQRLDGVPTTTGARTVIDMGDRLDDDGLVALTDDAICARVTSRRWLYRRATVLAQGRAGAGTIRRVTRPGAEGEFWSWLERNFDRHCVERGLPRADFNVAIRDARGFVGYADACFAPFKCLVELHGLRFHRRPATRRHDEAKRNRYVLAGWLVLTFTWLDLQTEPERVFAQLTEALAAPIQHPKA